MTLKKTLYIILVSALAACNSQESQDPEPKQELTVVQHDRFQNGWYAVINEKGGIPMQLHGAKETFTIDPTEIATQKNFKNVTKFTEKDCNSLIVRVDSTGAEALDLAIQFIKSKKLGLIINNELYYVQDLTAPGFAKVKKGTPADVFGETVAIPCNALSAADLEEVLKDLTEKK